MSKDITQIVDNLCAIAQVLELEVDQSDIVGMTDKMHRLVNVASLAADAESRAEALMNRKIADEMIHIMDTKPNLTANTIKDLSKAKAHVEVALHTKAVRIGRYVSHGLESLRSAISLYKSELENNLHHAKG